jgi:hypothetical protein
MLMSFSCGPGDFLKEPKVYEDLVDLTVLKTAMETALNEYNLSPSVVPMQLVLFREAIEHSERSLPPALLFSNLGFPSKATPKSSSRHRFPFRSDQCGLFIYSFGFETGSCCVALASKHIAG